METEDVKTQIPTKPSGGLLAVGIVSAVVVALVASGSVYTFEKSQNNKAQKDLQAEINSLKSQLATATTPITSAVPTSTPTPASTALSTPLPSSAPTAAPTPGTQADIAAARQAATAFMDLQVGASSTTISEDTLLSDRSQVLEMMTVPQTAEETSEFATLTGTDMGLPNTTQYKYPQARIFAGTAGFPSFVTSYILGAGSENGSTITFAVSETRRNWTGTDYVTVSDSTNIQLIRSGNGWVINQYSVNGGNTSIGKGNTVKYSAFYY